jgi:cell division protein FtsI (penicillin-binding protein 3)
MGMFSRVGIELPEAGLPLVQSAQAWKEIVTLTVAFGHGISVSPLHVARGTAAIANGGVIVRPTLIAQEPGSLPPDARPVMQPATSETMRRLMRLVVTDGFGKTAEVAGYYPGGKTGTAEKVGNRAYKKRANIAAFTSVFPMHAPRYAVYMMLDEPQANASTHGYATAGWVVAPAAGRVIARTGPMLGLLPDTEHAAQINAALAIPLQPARPPAAMRSPPVAAAPRPASPPPASPPVATGQPPRDNRPGGTPVPAVSPRQPSSPPATPPPGLPTGPSPRDLRHEAARTPPAPILPAQYVGSPLAAR